jgi:hypothetical protein
MSLSALAMVLGHALLVGRSHESDEGTLAHIFQLLMALQAPILIFFFGRWMPHEPTRALPVFALQVCAAAVAVAAVIFLASS